MGTPSSIRRIVIAVLAVVILSIVDQVAPIVDNPAKSVLFIGRFHVIAVHIPIGVLVLVAAFELGSLRASWRRRIDPIIGPTLEVLVVSSVGAFLLGSMLGLEGGYPDEILRWHRRLALGTIVTCAACLAIWTRAHRGMALRRLYRVSVGLAVALLSAGAHFGGSLTHGQGYLLRYAPWAQESAAPPPEPTEDALTVFAGHVEPILETYCGRCHGADRARGGFRVDTFEGLVSGGEGGPAVVPERPRASLLLARMLLPRDHPDRMPPQGEPEPSEDEVALIEWWIARGAQTELTVADALPSPGALALLTESRLPKTSSDASKKQIEPDRVTAVPPPKPAKSSSQRREISAAAIFASRCNGCHGVERTRGGLRTDSVAALIRGGHSGPAIVPGRPDDSPVVRRIRLPPSRPGHMPPKGSVQLSDDEVATIARWVGTLAPETVRRDEPTEVGSFAEVGRNTDDSRAMMAPSANPEQAVLQVTSVLRRRCGGCHGGAHPAGGLLLDDPGDVRDPREFLRRIELSPDAEGHMPPRGSSQLSTTELHLLKTWAASAVSEGSSVVTNRNSTAPSASSAPATSTPPRDLVVDAPRGGCAACRLGPSPRSDAGGWARAAAALALGLRRRRDLRKQ